MKRLLGQLAPNAAALTTLYTVPDVRSIEVTALVICNRSDAAATFRVAIAARAAVDTGKQYLFYDSPIAGRQTLAIARPGWMLQPTDIMRVYADTANLSFTLFGEEE